MKNITKIEVTTEGVLNIIGDVSYSIRFMHGDSQDDLLEVLFNYASYNRIEHSGFEQTLDLHTTEHILALDHIVYPFTDVYFAYMLCALSGIPYEIIRELKRKDLDDSELKRSFVLKGGDWSTEPIENSDWYCLVAGHCAEDDEYIFDLPENEETTVNMLRTWGYHAGLEDREENMCWRNARLSYFLNQLDEEVIEIDELIRKMCPDAFFLKG